MINMTQKQLMEILEEFYIKGNLSTEIKAKDIIDEMSQYILIICSNNSLDTE